MREFFLHLFTITVGLLIALGLENVAERVHHHHQRDEADAYLQRELRDNERELGETMQAAATERTDLLNILTLLHEREANQPSTVRQLRLNFTSGNLSSAGWQIATATTAVSYMEYARAEQFAGAYQVQAIFQRLNDRTLDDFLKLQSYVAGGLDPNQIPPEQARVAEPDVRRTLADVVALQQVGGELRDTYQKVLTSPDR